MSLISVVVPIYNVETYLPRALDSILSQTHKDWEAILVDDGSTDESGAIAENYAARDARFRVLHTPNSGVSQARNAALRIAKGKYLIFLDSDDFLHPQLMQLCLEAAQRNGSDIVAFNYSRLHRTLGKLSHQLHLPEPRPCFRHYNNPTALTTDHFFLFTTDFTRHPDIPRRWAVKHCHPCCRFYKTSLVSDIQFPNHRYEDIPWWAEVVLRIRQATILNLPLYYYYYNAQSYSVGATLEQQVLDLRAAINSSRSICQHASQEQRLHWEKHFIAPAEHLLEKKLNRLKAKTKNHSGTEDSTSNS